MRRLASIEAVLLVATACAQAQQESATQWLISAISGYNITPNIVYAKANGFECKLDVIAARDHSRPRPTVVYIHGGGWVGGTKEDALLQILPYLTKGMNAVNVEYRLASVSLAPGAVEDCRCALRWVYDHGKDYGFDLSKLIVTGHSAGGHLSLMTGMLPSSAGFDNQCPGSPEMKVAAIVKEDV